MADRILDGIIEFVLLSLLFGGATLVLGGFRHIKPSPRQIENWRVNLSYYAFDLLFAVPVLVIIADNVRGAVGSFTWPILTSWSESLPVWGIALATVALSDFVGYWRHRLMHIALFWPVHAAHHSDKDLVWFSLVRFHPLNRLVSVLFDAAILSALGIPIWAVIFSNRVRHYYGYLVHSDLGWRYGPLKYLLVSPFLHRWHHATNREARDRNFATVFSLYDLLFGTFYCPERKAEKLGVTDAQYPASFVGQLWYPFRIWGQRMRAAAEIFARPRTG